MSDDENQIECAEHGKTPATFICRHLSEGEGLGFHEGHDPENPDDLYPDAWCDACEEVLEREGEWNDTSEGFANIKIVCANCYQDIRERNWKQDDDAFNHMISTSFDYLKNLQDAFMDAYDIGKHERWDWDQETGKLIFSDEEKPVVECDIDFVGTVSTATDTWMWAWANESFTENVKQRSRQIRRIGVENHYLKLACGHWAANEVDGWEMTSIMAKETGALGAYRTPSDHGFVYMVIHKARWVTPNRFKNILSFFSRK